MTTVSIIAALLLTAPTGINANQIRTVQPSAVNLSTSSVAEGNSIGLARADHAHSLTGILPQASGGTGSGSVTCAAGQVLTSDGTGYSCVSAGLTVYARASVPACDGTKLANEVVVHDVGQPDETWVCELTAAAAYQWTSYAQVPNSTAQVMADGTVVVTVGISSSSGLTITGTAAGAPTTVIYDADASANEDLSVVQFVAVGATKRFTSVDFKITDPLRHSRCWYYGAWSINFANDSNSTAPTSCCARTPNFVPTYHRSTTGGGDSPTGGWSATTGVHVPVVYSDYALSWGYTPWGRSGSVSWVYNASEWTYWPKGWRQYGSAPMLPEPAPTGVDASQFYWISFRAVTTGRFVKYSTTVDMEFRPVYTQVTATAVY
jgi:hypothetical protein